MFREVLEFLTSDGWPVTRGEHDGLPCIDTRFDGSRRSWGCRARPYDPFGQFVFESILPEPVDADARTAFVDLVLRMNFKLLTGAFHIDLDGSEVVFRTTLLLPDLTPVTPVLCKGVIYGNVLTMDRCLDEVLAVAHGAPVAPSLERLAL